MQEMLRRHKLVFISTITVIASVVLDLLTKQLVVDSMPLYSRIELIDGFINIVHAKNYGSAFSFLHDAPTWFRKPFFIIIPMLAMGLIVAIMIKGKHSVMNLIALSLILSGALGNLISRIFYGFVTDFIDVQITATYHWPTFNVADIAITIGVIIIFLDMMKLEIRKKKQQKNKKPKRKKK